MCILPISCLQGTGVGSEEQDTCGHSSGLQRTLPQSDRKQRKLEQLPAVLGEGE